MVAAAAIITIITTIIAILTHQIGCSSPPISNGSFRVETISYVFLVLPQNW